MMRLSENHDPQCEELTWGPNGESPDLKNFSAEKYMERDAIGFQSLRDRLLNSTSESRGNNNVVIIIETDFISHFLVDILGLAFDLPPLSLWPIILRSPIWDIWNIRISDQVWRYWIAPSPWHVNYSSIEIQGSTLLSCDGPSGLRASMYQI